MKSKHTALTTASELIQVHGVLAKLAMNTKDGNVREVAFGASLLASRAVVFVLEEHNISKKQLNEKLLEQLKDNEAAEHYLKLWEVTDAMASKMVEGYI